MWSKDKKNIWNYFIQIEKNFGIGPSNDSDISPGYKVNHSCNPNSYISGQITLKAMLDIETNEEITYDYAMMNYLPSKDKVSAECKCGSHNCRRKLTTEDWKNKELQERYKGYF
ncbi:MAG: SET domain-containing protein-lysine N-methyltransferase, partial [Nanoarchaeota archaeon]